MYEPPNDAKIFPDPDEYISEWQFENLSKCIIPRKGYGNGSKEKDNLDTIKDYDVKKRAKFATITSRESCQGQLMTFSFQVAQNDEICCYLIHNGQQHRFYPQVKNSIFIDGNSYKA